MDAFVGSIFNRQMECAGMPPPVMFVRTLEPVVVPQIWKLLSDTRRVLSSITLLPPSPKSARNHVAVGWYQLVPLSCVPPIVKFGSSGWIARLWNWVALRPAVLRLDHVAPASDERQMPPSFPSYTMLE